MLLTDIVPIEKWKALEDDLYRRSGLESNVFDVNGVRITDNKRWVNKICPAVKADDRGQSFICAVAHMNLAIQARNTAQPVIGECDAGLLKLVVPIFFKGDFLGAVGACGLVLDDGEVDTFMLNKTIDLDEDKAESLAEGIDRISTETVQALAADIQARIRGLCNHA